MSKATGRVMAVRMLGQGSHPPPPDPLEAPEIRRLTEEYLRLRASGESHAVEATIEMGQKIRTAKPKIRGRVERWFREDLHVSKVTASHQQALAEFADRDPSAVTALRLLGVAKLFRVCRLQKRGVTALRRHTLDDLVAMSLRRFTKFTNRHRLTPGRRPRLLLIHQAAARAEKWTVTIRNWRRLKPSEPAERKRFKLALDGMVREVRRVTRHL